MTAGTAWAVALVPPPSLAPYQAGALLGQLGPSAVLTMETSGATSFEVEVQVEDPGAALERVRELWQRTGQDEPLLLHARRCRT